MEKTLSSTTRRRLDVQGMNGISDEALAEIFPWQRMAYLMCSILAGVGTALASPIILWILVPVAGLAALFPVHPFDLIYNHGIRHFRKTGPLPKRAAQGRFACGIATVWLIATALAFQSGFPITAYVLGFSLTFVGLLVGTTDICIPSIIYNAIFLRKQDR